MSENVKVLNAPTILREVARAFINGKSLAPPLEGREEFIENLFRTADWLDSIYKSARVGK